LITIRTFQDDGWKVLQWIRCWIVWNPTSAVHRGNRLQGDSWEFAEFVPNHFELWRDFRVHVGSFCRPHDAEHRVRCDSTGFLLRVHAAARVTCVFGKDFLCLLARSSSPSHSTDHQEQTWRSSARDPKPQRKDL
jgi:hypothetical protein